MALRKSDEATPNKGLLLITLTVENKTLGPPRKYNSSVPDGGVLLGALTRLKETQQDFKFTVKMYSDFGIFLESVNGVPGNVQDKTYWELLSEKSGKPIKLHVGIGCYTPKAGEHIILRFTTSGPSDKE